MRVELGTLNELLIWKLQDKLSIEEAVALMCGIVPEGDNRTFLTYTNRDTSRWPKGVLPLVRLITNAIESKKVEGNIVYYDSYDAEIDYGSSMVEVASLSHFLKSKHVVDHFFNDTVAPKAEYLDSQHPCYAPKLAAAVMAWEQLALASGSQEQGTPKQRIEKWLRLNAAKFGLNKADGALNELGIEEIAKIANWQPQGGAAQTPMIKSEVLPEPDLAIRIPRVEVTRPPLTKPKKLADDAPFDSDIPF